MNEKRSEEREKRIRKIGKRRELRSKSRGWNKKKEEDEY